MPSTPSQAPPTPASDGAANSPQAPTSQVARTSLLAPEPRFNLKRSLGRQRFGAFDPSAALELKGLTKAYFSSEGPMLASITQDNSGLHFQVTGPGARQELDRWTALWPPDDGYADFVPSDRFVNRLHRSLQGLRIVRQPWLFDVACQTILQQRVTWEEALRSWRKMTKALGTAIGDYWAFPPPSRVGRLPAASLRVFDIDLPRAKAIVALARAELSQPFLNTTSSPEVVRSRMRALPGIGVWTTELTLGAGVGDPDAMPTGDLHLPHTVSWALAGEARGSDERMVELLEPYRGQRFRVIKLLSAGKLKAPSFAPKKPRRRPR